MTVLRILKNITAENVFSTPAQTHGPFNFSLTGTWEATVHIQRSFDGGATWADIESFTANVEKVGNAPESGVLYRFGVKAGNYTSGTVVGRLSQ